MHGQLGTGNSQSTYKATNPVGLPSGVQAVATGHYHSCALADSAVYCWGDNFQGQIGTGADENMPVALPSMVTGLPMGEVTAITAGDHHTCALTNGEVWCWGMNTYAQLGIDIAVAHSSVPLRVEGLPAKIHSVVAGHEHNCVLAGEEVWCWGFALYGQLGRDLSTNYSFYSFPVRVEGLTSTVEVLAAGRDYTCAITKDGVWCWGGLELSPYPMKIEGFGGEVRGLVANELLSIALVDGAALAWEATETTRVDTGRAIWIREPKHIEAIAISFVTRHNCALSEGSFWCWGYNNVGEVGNGTTSNIVKPTKVIGL